MQHPINALRNNCGQGLLEYVILLALVALICVGSAKSLGFKLNAKIKEIKDQIDSSVSVNVSR